MTKPVVTIVDQTPVDALATLMRRRRVKQVPVLKDGKLVGIVSRADLLEALVRRADVADETGLSAARKLLSQLTDSASERATVPSTRRVYRQNCRAMSLRSDLSACAWECRRR